MSREVPFMSDTSQIDARLRVKCDELARAKQRLNVDLIEKIEDEIEDLRHQIDLLLERRKRG